jgi:hypothetical protein
MAQVATQTLEKCPAVVESFLRSGHQGASAVPMLPG